MMNIEGDVERIMNDMYVQFRQTFPWVGRDVKIEIGAWEYDHKQGRHVRFQVWYKDHFIAHDRPLSEWDEFIEHYKLLFRDFSETPF